MWASGVMLPQADIGQLDELGKARGRAQNVAGIEPPGRSWSELTTANPVFKQVKTLTAQPVWTIPVTTGGSTVADTASGRHDREWGGFGRVLATLPKPSVVRLTMPTDTDAAQARTAYRRAAALIQRTGGAKAIIEWTAPIGSAPTSDTAWPGDDSVDVVGVVIPADGSWNQILNGPGGLTAWSDFSASHGKRIAVHWELAKDTSPAEVRSIRGWLDLSATQKRVAYETTTSTLKGPKDAVATYLKLWGLG